MVRRAFLLSRALFASLSLVFVELASTCCRAQFNTVINIPPDAPPINVDSNTQLNLYDGGLLSSHIRLGSILADSHDIEFNMNGGNANSITITSGTTMNMNGGRISGPLYAVFSTINIFDGVIENGVTSGPFTFMKTTTNMYGGTIRSRVIMEESGVLNLYGGTIVNDDGLQIQTRQDSQVNFFVRSFSIGGVEVTDLQPGVRRDYGYLSRVFSGTLSDGSPFVLGNPGGQVSVTLVPEPLLLTYLATIAVACVVARHRRPTRD